MSDNQKCFTGTLVATRDVTVFADSPEEAAKTIQLLYESGDACAEVGGATVTDVRQTDDQGNEYLDVYLFFDDETATMMADLREDFVKKLVKREKALYAIALECFNELCAGMAPESIRKRLDDAIENTIKEQA